MRSALCLVLAAAVCACGVPSALTTPSPTPPAPAETRAVVELEKGGSFAIALRPDAAPNTVANFLEKARAGAYDGLTFHRVEDWVVQGGDPSGDGTGGGRQPTELSDLPFLPGAVGLARGPDIAFSNDSQFFVCTGDCRHLDGAYTNFGSVVSGMDVVRGIRVGDRIRTIRIE